MRTKGGEEQGSGRVSDACSYLLRALEYKEEIENREMHYAEQVGRLSFLRALSRSSFVLSNHSYTAN